MEYRFLGSTGLKVSVLGLGTMTFHGSGSDFFRGVGGVDDDVARRMVDTALDIGVNFIDTADVYSRGESESMLGRVLKGRRDRTIVATKVHGRMTDDPNDAGQSRHHITESCHASLRRLGVDHIDLYQIHNFDAWTSWEESLGALTRLVDQGKIRYIGCSNLAAWQLMKALSVSEQRGLDKFVSLQANYSLMARELEHELVPLCESEGVGVTVWGPLAGGVLSGKYHGEAPSAEGRRNAVGDPGHVDESTVQKVLAAMGMIAKVRNASLAEVAVNFVKARKFVSSVLVGARTYEQFAQNMRCAEWDLDQSELDALVEASARPLPYPYWHQARHNAARYRRG